MKARNLFLSLVFITSQASSFAMTGLDLLTAKTEAFNQYQFEAELEEVEAWAAEVEGDEVHVQIKSHDGMFEYGCDLHGDEIVCHEGGDHHLKSEGISALDAGFAAATAKLNKTLSRRGASLANVTAYKVWAVGDHDHGHGENADIYTKVNYTLNGANKTTFVQCHQHHGDTQYFCHYRASAPNEPTFEDGDHDDHDDHDDHGHDHGHNH